ncbi:MAG: homogentisate 1,2-dioxygenase [Bdellovibrionales bacterium CG10_big_fil_rev_8_21_14_0_10_45_34]|nr:MAG: homogentisate 1,2-dioxygenase [Bdellovibrionales bacterium CG10_big_fil_rev_8_21_14_0_10_45_34]
MSRKQPKYLSGFPNYHCSEALPGALPERGNSPQRPKFGLYAEQLSGSSFTAPRELNLRSWLYRIKPTVGHSSFVEEPTLLTDSLAELAKPSPEQYRWNPLRGTASTSFLKSLRCIVSNGSGQQGGHVFLYNFNDSSLNEFLISSDGEWMIIPYQGELEILTEFGILVVEPLEFAVIPRGVKFQVRSSDASGSSCAGYVLENCGSPFRLPELGPIGSNGLASPRDFLAPVAHYFDEPDSATLFWKYQDRIFKTQTPGHPLDVIAWHGNYFPYKYDLRKFNTIGTISFDHPDPSIFTVLTSASEKPGFANFDFAIFPPRWMVAEDTFRPPYYHRNLMSEYMGMICGTYDAKETGFVPGASSLHNSMSGHGPDVEAFKKATESQLKPMKLDNTMAFMWESRHVFTPTKWALSEPGLLQNDYLDCWKKLPRNFKP